MLEALQAPRKYHPIFSPIIGALLYINMVYLYKNVWSFFSNKYFKYKVMLLMMIFPPFLMQTLDILNTFINNQHHLHPPNLIKSYILSLLVRKQIKVKYKKHLNRNLGTNYWMFFVQQGKL